MARTTTVCALMAVLLAAPAALASDASRALQARNPYLAALKDHDPRAFEKAVAIITRAERGKGFRPEVGAPPAAAPTGRGMDLEGGRDLTAGNPDLLWLYGASPEGMHDLISLLKSAGQRPKS